MENTVLGDLRKNDQFEVLVDSDAFIGRVYPNDAHHKRANKIFKALRRRSVLMVTTSLVVAETATVLSHRDGQLLARTFLKLIAQGEVPVVHITESLQKEALELFKEQTKKGSSVTDCANVVVARKLQIPTIFSFDKVYPGKFGIDLAG